MKYRSSIPDAEFGPKKPTFQRIGFLTFFSSLTQKQGLIIWWALHTFILCYGNIRSNRRPWPWPSEDGRKLNRHPNMTLASDSPGHYRQQHYQTNLYTECIKSIDMEMDTKLTALPNQSVHSVYQTNKNGHKIDNTDR